MLELGQDYMKAGLFDRAEGLFKELIENNVHLSSVLPLLLDIYQQEKDWANAIGIAAQMGFVGGQPARSVIAQFYCELAENARARENVEEACQLAWEGQRVRSPLRPCPADCGEYCPATEVSTRCAGGL